MGQPIYLKKGKDTMTVYGPHQAAVHVKEGWELADDSIILPTAPVPEVDTASEAFVLKRRLNPIVTFDEVDATDAARELAAEHGIDLEEVEGTGANGRITVGDVKALLEDGD